MPNWCYTKIRITSGNKEQLKNLYNKYCLWLMHDAKPNDFSKGAVGWLGNIVEGCKLWLKNKDGEYPVRYRGSVDEIKYEDGEIHLTTTTAWVPMLTVFRETAKALVPDSEVFYWSYEPMCEYVGSNEGEYQDRYYTEVFSGSATVMGAFDRYIKTPDSATLYEVKRFLWSLLSKRVGEAAPIATIDSLLGHVYNKYPDCGISVFKYDNTPVEEMA